MSNKKHKKHHKPKQAAPKESVESKKALAKDNNEGISTKVLLLLTFVLAIVYFVFSTFSNGFYMHDEVGNFMNSKNLWHDDLIILLARIKRLGIEFYMHCPL